MVGSINAPETGNTFAEFQAAAKMVSNEPPVCLSLHSNDGIN
jgi:hypothetical protein